MNYAASRRVNPDIMQPQSKQAKTKNHFRRLK
jgi:hypothetical protein